MSGHVITEAQRPQPGARVRLDDGRFGTIALVGPAPGGSGLLRVQVDMDDGVKGYTDVPDPVQARAALLEANPSADGGPLLRSGMPVLWAARQLTTDPPDLRGLVSAGPSRPVPGSSGSDRQTAAQPRRLWSLLLRAIQAVAGNSSGNTLSDGGFGFACRCGLTGGPWPTQGEAECLGGIHDHLQHGLQPGSRAAQIVPAGALPARTDGAHSPSGVQITAQSGLSIGGGQW